MAYSPRKPTNEIKIFDDGQLIGAAEKINFGLGIVVKKVGDTINVESNAQTIIQYEITQENLDTKQFQLPHEPQTPMAVRIIPAGGVEQINGIDFEVTGSTVSFGGFFKIKDRSKILIVIF